MKAIQIIIFIVTIVFVSMCSIVEGEAKGEEQTPFPITIIPITATHTPTPIFVTTVPFTRTPTPQKIYFPYIRKDKSSGE